MQPGMAGNGNEGIMMSREHFFFFTPSPSKRHTHVTEEPMRSKLGGPNCTLFFLSPVSERAVSAFDGGGFRGLCRRQRGMEGFGSVVPPGETRTKKLTPMRQEEKKTEPQADYQ